MVQSACTIQQLEITWQFYGLYVPLYNQTNVV